MADLPNGVCCSRPNVVLESHVWVIEKFSLCRARRKKIKSDTIVSAKDARLQWFMELDPSHFHKCNDDFDTESTEHVSLLLTVLPHVIAEEEEKSVRITVSIMSSKKRRCKTTTHDMSFRFSSGIKDFIADLIDIREYDYGDGDYLDYDPEDEDGDLLPNDTLTITYEIEVLLGYENRTVTSGNTEDLQCILGSDLMSLLEGGAYSDVTVIAGQVTIKAHKAILTARSPVFRAMFENNMKEAAENCVEITDIDPLIVQEMLSYMYTGTAPKVEKMAALLQAADKYDLKQLKAICEKELISQLSEENVSATFKLAHRYSATQLKAKCTGFMAIHTPHLVSKYICPEYRDGEDDSASTTCSKKRKTQ
eukprot:Em0002g312a